MKLCTECVTRPTWQITAEHMLLNFQYQQSNCCCIDKYSC